MHCVLLKHRSLVDQLIDENAESRMKINEIFGLIEVDLPVVPVSVVTNETVVVAAPPSDPNVNTNAFDVPRVVHVVDNAGVYSVLTESVINDK